MVIVIDNGSAQMKVGIAGADSPKFIFPTVVADAKSSHAIVGEEALAKGSSATLTRPYQDGEVKDWEAMEKVWEHAFKLVGGVDNRPVLLTESILTPNENRFKICKIMFEKFNVPSLFIAKQPILALYASGRKTGFVIEIGEGVTQFVPIFDGFAVTEAMTKTDFAGAKITEYLRSQLKLADTETARVVKESLCYIVADPEAELKKDPSALEASHTLPDGSEVKVGAERVKAPELFFNPAQGGFQYDSLQKMLADCIQKCEIDVRRKLNENVVLSGQSSLFKGMHDRMNALTPGNVKLIKVPAEYMVWIGGSILGSLDIFEPLPLTKKEFEEGGMQAMLHKFG